MQRFTMHTSKLTRALPSNINIASFGLPYRLSLCGRFTTSTQQSKTTDEDLTYIKNELQKHSTELEEIKEQNRKQIRQNSILCGIVCGMTSGFIVSWYKSVNRTSYQSQ